MARAYPALRIVGIDVFESALDLARHNVTSEGLDGRVALELADVTSLDDEPTYDVVLPLADLLTAQGFSDAQEVGRTWDAPVRLFAGRRA